MFFQFDYSTRNIFNSDKDKFLVISYIIFNTNYAEAFNGLKKQECYVSYTTLEDGTGIGKTKLKRILKELEEEGYIEWIYKSKSKYTASILRLKTNTVNNMVNNMVDNMVDNTVNDTVKPLIDIGLNGDTNTVDNTVNNTVNNMVDNTVNIPLSIKHINNSIKNNINNSIKNMGECLLTEEDNCMSGHQKDSSINALQTGSEHQYGLEYGLDYDNQVFNGSINTVENTVEHHKYNEILNELLDQETNHCSNSNTLQQVEETKEEEKTDIKPSETTINQDLENHKKTTVKKVKVSEEQIESIWALYPNKKGKATAIKKIPKLIEQYGYDQVQRAVERYAAEIKRKNTAIQYVKHGDTFFNSGYMDYLDTNYNQEQQLEAEGHNKFGMYEHNDDMDEMERLALERRKRLAEERQQRNNT